MVDPDVDGPAAVVEKAVEALRAGRNQYAPGPGVPELRRAIASHQARHYGLDLDPEREVLVTAGATEAIAAAILALVDPGDEVVLLDEDWPASAQGLRIGVIESVKPNDKVPLRNIVIVRPTYQLSQVRMVVLRIEPHDEPPDTVPPAGGTQ